MFSNVGGIFDGKLAFYVFSVSWQMTNNSYWWHWVINDDFLAIND